MKRIVPKICAALIVSATLCATFANAGESTIKIGWGRRSINPGCPVAITGQLYLRVSLGEYKPVTADALVLENGRDAVIFVSVDMVLLRGGILDRVKDYLSKAAPEIPGNNMVNTDVPATNADATYTVNAIKNMIAQIICSVFFSLLKRFVRY